MVRAFRSPIVVQHRKLSCLSLPGSLDTEKGEVADVSLRPRSRSPAAPRGLGAGGATFHYYKIKPKYPKAALVAGEEGWVMLKVDVTESGEVENVRMVDGNKRNLSQEEARRAVPSGSTGLQEGRNPDGRPIIKSGWSSNYEYAILNSRDDLIY